MATFVTAAGQAMKSPAERSRFAYWAMLVFSFLYYFRPEDVIPGLHAIPLAKITGGVALLALFLGTGNKRPKKLPSEIKLLLVMFFWLVLTVPFAWWRGGSFVVVAFEFSKAVIIGVTLTLTVFKFAELKRLVFVQAFGVALGTLGAVIINHRFQGRLAGPGEGILLNPNDLAINIAVNWPLCLGFALAARGILSRVFWGLSLLVMVYVVMATYSRSGFLALLTAGVLCLWEFGLRGKRFYMLIAALLLVVAMSVISPQNYSRRLETLTGTFQAGDKDRGSAEARMDLLVDSLKITITHPLFGIGPGNYPAYTKTWLVTHNTYTQFSSECGIPALIMFLLLLKKAFWNAGKVRKFMRDKQDKEMRILAGALWAGLGAYCVGAFFSATAYQLFPYYMVTYTTVLYKLAFASDSQPAKAEAAVRVPRRSIWREEKPVADRLSPYSAPPWR